MSFLIDTYRNRNSMTASIPVKARYTVLGKLKREISHLDEDQEKGFKKKRREDFRYGNYHQYYGYRNQGTIDTRLIYMKKKWFYAKDVLDIGCNAGHFTYSIAKDLEPKSVTGIDIDHELVKMAKRNIRHYINPDMFSNKDFPSSLILNYGPVAQAVDPKHRYLNGKFPFNIQFIQGNYIFPCDAMLPNQEPHYDTILCLSVTKWIHLNWGDEGIKRLFHRVYAHLRGGGYFILEAQAYQSYARKKKITEEMHKHYTEIKFYPDMFNEFLVKDVGFKTCELIDIPAHSSKGFSRPIYLFVKEYKEEKKPIHIYYDTDSSCSDSSSSVSPCSDSDTCNYSDIEQLSE